MKMTMIHTFAYLVLAGCISLPAAAQQDYQANRDRDDRQQSRQQDSQRDWQEDSWNDRQWQDDRDRMDQDRENRDRQQQDRQRQDRQRQDRQQADQQRRDQRQTDQQQYRLRPQGWIGVAYDYDNDGFYEAADYMYYYDLRRAQQSSDQRAQDEQRRRHSRSQQARSGDRRNREQVRVRGEIVDMGIKNLTMGSDERSDRDHRFARIETDSGRSLRVCLGSEDKVAQLDLQEGDRVTIDGVRARIDDKMVVLARRVSAGGDSITNQLPRRERWQRVSGEIRDVRTAGGDDRDQRHTVVEVRTNQGPRQVDLGPASEVQNLDLREGDDITVLARQGKIGGQSMLIAQKLRANGETVDVREATSRSLGRSGDSRDGRTRR